MNTHPFEVVDAQVHINSLDLETAVTTMDAVGVDAVVIDEFTGFDPKGRVEPGFELPGGAWVSTPDYSAAAVAAHPDRFAYITRVDPADPDLDARIEQLRDRPGCRALRLIPFVPVHPLELTKDPRNVQVSRDAAAGFSALIQSTGYERFWALAAKHGIPVFLQINGTEIPGDFALARTLATRHPDLRLIVDHTGLELPGAWIAPRPGRFAQLPDLLSLAELPNIALKWGHGPLLSEQPYPFRDVQDVLHRVVDAFGVERVMWASDWTVDILHNSWAESLGTVLDDSHFSVAEKSWLLGRSARAALDWPSATV